MKIINQTAVNWEQTRLRGMAYGALSNLCTAVPSSFINSLDLFNLLLEHLQTEEAENTRECITDALRGIRSSYAKARPEVLENLSIALRQKLRDKSLNRNGKYIILEWLTTIFPFSNAIVRLTCIQFLKHEDPKLGDLAARSILPQITAVGTLEPYPNFCKFVGVAYQATCENRERFSEFQFMKILEFSKKCFKANAMLQKTSKDKLWQEVGLPTKDSVLEKNAHEKFYDLCSMALEIYDVNRSPGETLHSVAFDCLTFFNKLELNLRFCDPAFLLNLISNLRTDGLEARKECSEFLALVTPSSDENIISKIISALTSDLRTFKTETKIPRLDGCLRGLGRILGSLTDMRNLNSDEVQSLQLIVEILLYTKEDLHLPATLALKHIAKSRPLPLQEDEEKRVGEVESIISRCLELVKSNLKQKRNLSESTLEFLGAMAAGESSQTVLKMLREELLKLASIKEEDVQFAVGDALTALVMNSVGFEGKEFEIVLEHISEKLIRIGSAISRQAGCTWLLCITKGGKDFPKIQQYLPQIQETFLPLLAESRQFTSECAAKGLAFCYETGDKSMKGDLVKALRKTFNQGKRVVRENTDIQTSKGLKTFQELSEIANEMRSPDMLYKFLDIAGNHAAWTSKRGAAFSLGSLLKTCEELKPQLDSLIPKLFRYRFDPNQMIKTTMTTLWRSLVENPEEAVKKHYHAIMKDCLRCMQSKEVRVLIASSFAVLDLIDGKMLDEIEKYLETMWEKALFLCDYHQKAVVEAALRLAKHLQSSTKRMCDPQQSKPEEVDRALKIMMPWFLKHFNNHKKVFRMFVVATTIEVVSVGKKHLVPYLPELMRTLVTAIGSWEPQVLSYMAAQSLDMEQKKQLDSVRNKVALQNPLNDALMRCERVMTKEAVDPVVREVLRVISRGVGYGAVQASVRLLDILLRGKFKEEMKSHGKRIVSVLGQAIIDCKSASMSKHYASVVGKLCAVATQKRVESVVDLIYESFTERGESGFGPSLHLANALIKEAHSRVIGMDKFFAVVFVGCSLYDDELQPEFDALRIECGGSPFVCGKYRKGIRKLIETFCDNQTYKLVKVGYESLRDYIQTLGTDLGKEEALELLSYLQTQLQGRIWKGKQIMFNSVECILKAFPQCLDAELLSFLQLQCIRKNIKFQCGAMSMLTKVFEKWENQQNLKVLPTTMAAVNELLGVEAKLRKDDNTEERRKEEQEKNNLRSSTFRYLGASFACDGAGHDMFGKPALEKFEKEFRGCHWIVKAALLKGFEAFLKGIKVKLDYSNMVTILLEFGLGAQFAPVRLNSVKCLKVMLATGNLENGSSEVMKIILGAGQLMQTESKEMVTSALFDLVNEAKKHLSTGV